MSYRKFVIRRKAICKWCGREIVWVMAPAPQNHWRVVSIPLEPKWMEREREPYRLAEVGDVAHSYIRIRDGTGGFVVEWGFPTQDLFSAGIRWGWKQHICGEGD